MSASESALREVFDKTGGVCHLCGDKLSFEKRGRGGKAKGVYDVPSGFWEVDHVHQRSRGGNAGFSNALPACTACNRMRWHRSGGYTRQTLLLGLAARERIRRGSDLGDRLLKDAKQRWPLVSKWPRLGERTKKRAR
ncbi:MAG: HNH endonuclease [Acidobacteria bacterium]|nr:HNH endonuclease [Acidobacteriota bacterium]